MSNKQTNKKPLGKTSSANKPMNPKPNKKEPSKNKKMVLGTVVATGALATFIIPVTVAADAMQKSKDANKKTDLLSKQILDLLKKNKDDIQKNKDDIQKNKDDIQKNQIAIAQRIIDSAKDYFELLNDAKGRSRDLLQVETELVKLKQTFKEINAELDTLLEEDVKQMETKTAANDMLYAKQIKELQEQVKQLILTIEFLVKDIDKDKDITMQGMPWDNDLVALEKRLTRVIETAIEHLIEMVIGPLKTQIANLPTSGLDATQMKDLEAQMSQLKTQLTTLKPEILAEVVKTIKEKGFWALGLIEKFDVNNPLLKLPKVQMVIQKIKTILGIMDKATIVPITNKPKSKVDQLLDGDDKASRTSEPIVTDKLMNSWQKTAQAYWATDKSYINRRADLAEFQNQFKIQEIFAPIKDEISKLTSYRAWIKAHLDFITLEKTIVKITSEATLKTFKLSAILKGRAYDQAKATLFQTIAQLYHDYRVADVYQEVSRTTAQSFVANYKYWRKEFNKWSHYQAFKKAQPEKFKELFKAWKQFYKKGIAEIQTTTDSVKDVSHFVNLVKLINKFDNDYTKITYALNNILDNKLPTTNWDALDLFETKKHLKVSMFDATDLKTKVETKERPQPTEPRPTSEEVNKNVGNVSKHKALAAKHFQSEVYGKTNSLYARFQKWEQDFATQYPYFEATEPTDFAKQLNSWKQFYTNGIQKIQNTLQNGNWEKFGYILEEEISEALRVFNRDFTEHTKRFKTSFSKSHNRIFFKLSKKSLNQPITLTHKEFHELVWLTNERTINNKIKLQDLKGKYRLQLPEGWIDQGLHWYTTWPKTYYERYIIDPQGKRYVITNNFVVLPKIVEKLTPEASSTVATIEAEFQSQLKYFETNAKYALIRDSQIFKKWIQQWKDKWVETKTTFSDVEDIETIYHKETKNVTSLIDSYLWQTMAKSFLQTDFFKIELPKEQLNWEDTFQGYHYAYVNKQMDITQLPLYKQWINSYKIVRTTQIPVFQNKESLKIWKGEVITKAEEIEKIRLALRKQLKELNQPTKVSQTKPIKPLKILQNHTLLRPYMKAIYISQEDYDALPMVFRMPRENDEPNWLKVKAGLDGQITFVKSFPKYDLDLPEGFINEGIYWKPEGNKYEIERRVIDTQGIRYVFPINIALTTLPAYSAGVAWE